MADSKLTALAALASASDDDVLYISDGGVSKSITIAALRAVLGQITIEEADGSPSILRKKLRVPNNTLTDVDADTAWFVPLLRRLGDVNFTSFTGLGGRVLQIKATEDVVEAVAPLGVTAAGTLAPQLNIAVNGNNLEFTPRPMESIMAFQTAPATNSVAISAALAEWPNSQRRQLVDLQYATQCRLVVRAVFGFAAGSKLALIYSTNGFTGFSYMDGTGVAAGGGAGPVAAIDAANVTADSGWVALHANAKTANCHVALASVGGDGTTVTQTIGVISARFR